MSNRSWFFAASGQQQGPYPEAQFRDLIARGTVNAQTLVWSEGMAGWQKAGEVPGLMAGAGAPPPMGPQGGGPVMNAGGYGDSYGYGGGGSALSLDFGILEFTWRSILLMLGLLTVIGAPWVIVWYLKWFVSCVQVPGRPNLSFIGTAGTVALWYFGVIVISIVLAIIGSAAGSQAIGNLGTIFQVVLYWLFLKYLIANLASNGQPLGLSFSGSIWAYIGWQLLTVISFITIVGWAWAYTAQIRWICRNIQGTRRQVVYKGTGLELLWRAVVTGLASAFIIPIPWVYRWLLRWQLSQTELLPRG
jgi:hypothetical protein